MSIFGDFGRKVIASRQRSAERQICAALLGFDDATIEKAGYTRAELKRKAAGAVHY